MEKVAVSRGGSRTLPRRREQEGAQAGRKDAEQEARREERERRELEALCSSGAAEEGNDPVDSQVREAKAPTRRCKPSQRQRARLTKVAHEEEEDLGVTAGGDDETKWPWQQATASLKNPRRSATLQATDIAGPTSRACNEGGPSFHPETATGDPGTGRSSRLVGSPSCAGPRRRCEGAG